MNFKSTLKKVYALSYFYSKVFKGSYLCLLRLQDEEGRWDWNSIQIFPLKANKFFHQSHLGVNRWSLSIGQNSNNVIKGRPLRRDHRPHLRALSDITDRGAQLLWKQGEHVWRVDKTKAMKSSPLLKPFYTLDLFAPDPFKIMLLKGGSLWKLWNCG